MNDSPLLLPGFLSVTYGERLQYIPDTQKPAIEFFNKPDGRITFFLRESEINRKDLTELLKKIVEAMKIPFTEVNFGKILRPAQQTDFDKMKTPYGVILDLNYFPLDPGNTRTSAEGYYVVPCLEDMQGDAGEKRKAWNVLKALSDSYHAV